MSNGSSACRRWQRWENALTSQKRYDNLYADLTIKVSYTGPDDYKLDTYGFWDGNDI